MANLRFFGSTVDAIAPQEQNVLARYANQNLNIGLANQAAAERARAATINAWQFAQQNEQNQAQQGYANKVNLLQFGVNARNRTDDQAYQEATQMANYATPDVLEKYFGKTLPKARLDILKEFAGTRTKEIKKEDAADKLEILYDITAKAGKGAYLNLSPDQVAKMFNQPISDVLPALELGNKVYADGVVTKLNSETAKARIEAAKAFKKGERPSSDLSLEEIKLLPPLVGNVPPSVRYSHAEGRWTTEPEAQPSSNPLQEYRPGSMNPVAALAVSAPRTVTRSAPAIAFGPMGAGGVPRRSTSAPTVLTPPVLRAPVTATNAPALRPLDINTAREFLRQAGGDKNQARELARRAGFTF